MADILFDFPIQAAPVRVFDAISRPGPLCLEKIAQGLLLGGRDSSNTHSHTRRESMLTILQRLWDHIEWADGRILEALREAAGADRSDDVEQGGAVTAIDVIHEFAHVIGSEENWLARIQGRKPRAAIWPEVTLDELEPLLNSTHDGYRTYIAGLSEAEASLEVSYTNSAGRQFTNEVRDILLHVALHGQYHRGKVNLMLRQIGRIPAPTDYIAFARGVPAATTGESGSR